MRAPRSLYLAALLPGIAVIASGIRWLLQGSNNIYTAVNRRYYVPDPVLGWRVVHDGPFWLGLEVIGVLAGMAVGLLAAAWVVSWRERKLSRPWRWPRMLLWMAAFPPLAVPLWAFATGLGPDGARDRLPDIAAGQKVAPSGISGSLAGAPAGRYIVVAHEGSSITARVSAGGETFDTRFTGNIGGYLIVDTGDLSKPVEARVRVDAASVNTGIKARSNHAREYLKVTEFPELSLSLGSVLAARQGATQAELEFWARGTLEMMGQRHDTMITGTVRAADPTDRERLDVTAPALVVSADLLLPIKESGLAADAGDFDAAEIPIHVSLVLTRDQDVPNSK